MLLPQLPNLNPIEINNMDNPLNHEQPNDPIDDFDKIEVTFDDIYNKNESANMKDLLTCPICLNILITPVQCNKCNKCFCKECIDNYANSRSKCPFRCTNPLYNSNKFVENVLSILKFKCKNGCDKIINYEELLKHYQEDCDKIDYKTKYKELLKKYKELKNQNKNGQNANNAYRNNNVAHSMFQMNPHYNNNYNNNYQNQNYPNINNIERDGFEHSPYTAGDDE